MERRRKAKAQHGADEQELQWHGVETRDSAMKRKAMDLHGTEMNSSETAMRGKERRRRALARNCDDE